MLPYMPACLPACLQDTLELTQVQRRSILAAWHSYQEGVGAARQQTRQAIDVLQAQAQAQQEAGGAYAAFGGSAQAASEVRVSGYQ